MERRLRRPAEGALSLMAIALPKPKPSTINVPNHSYWFAPERRASTIQPLQVQIDSLAVAVSVLLAWMNESTIRSSFGIGVLTKPWVPLAHFGVFFIGWMVSILRAFPLRHRSS
jgi:hypothetical protein